MSPCGRVRLCIRSSFVVAVVSKPRSRSFSPSLSLLPFLRAILINLNSRSNLTDGWLNPRVHNAYRIYFSSSLPSLSLSPSPRRSSSIITTREKERETILSTRQLTTIFLVILFRFLILICIFIITDPRALTLQYFHYCYATDQTGERIFWSIERRGRGRMAFDSTALNKSPPLSPSRDTTRCIDNWTI